MIKKILIIIVMFVAVGIFSIVNALTMGIEPPKEFIKNLKTCTKGHFETKGATIERYDIKGKLPNGRCEVYMDTYTDYTQKENYEMAKAFIGGFAQMAKSMGGEKYQNKEIPTITQEDLVKLSQENILSVTCKFSQSDINDLINAYNKHDNQNPPPKKENGVMTFSFDSSKASSYDNLLLSYQFKGPCIQSTGNDKNWSTDIYVCEYSDTTCNVRVQTNNEDKSSSYSISCSGDKNKYEKLDNKMYQTVLSHVKSNMCEKL